MFIPVKTCPKKGSFLMEFFNDIAHELNGYSE